MFLVIRSAVALAIAIVKPSSDSRTPPYRPSIVGRIPIFGKEPRSRFTGGLETSEARSAMKPCYFAVGLRVSGAPMRLLFGNRRSSFIMRVMVMIVDDGRGEVIGVRCSVFGVRSYEYPSHRFTDLRIYSNCFRKSGGALQRQASMSKSSSSSVPTASMRTRTAGKPL